MQHFLPVLFISAGLAAILYLATRFAIGSRADQLIGGAAPIAFFVSPWWVGLAGAILGHVLAVMVMRKLTKQSQPKHLVSLALLSIGLYVGMSMYNINSLALQVIAAASKFNNKDWEAFAADSEANRFIFENYRPCIEAKSYTLLSVNSKHDPSLCRSSAVSQAAATKGHEFGQAVDAAIVARNARKPSDPEVDALVAKLFASV